MAYLSNTSVNGDLGVSGLTSVGSAGLKFTSGIINIFGSSNSGGTGNKSISIGSNAAATGENGIAIGYNAYSSKLNSIAIGSHSDSSSRVTASETCSIAIGSYNTKAAGSYSIALGYGSQTSATETVAIGDTAITSGENSIAIGYGAKATEYCSVAIGRAATSVAASTMVLGNSSYTSTIRLLSSSGTVVTSDARDKINIEPLKDSLGFINSLRPVTYNLNDRTSYAINDDEIDKENDEYKKYLIEKNNFNLEIPYYNKEEYKNGTKAHERNLVGLVAQDVVDSVLEYYGSEDYVNLVNRDSYNSGRDINSSNDSSYDKLYMNYTSFIPILIKAIQEQEEKIKSLEDKISLLLEEKK